MLAEKHRHIPHEHHFFVLVLDGRNSHRHACIPTELESPLCLLDLQHLQTLSAKHLIELVSMLLCKLSHLEALSEPIQRYILTEISEMSFFCVILSRPES